MTHTQFRELVSGATRGIPARLARAALKAASLFYEAGVRARNAGYDAGLFRRHRAAVPVVSVGNLTVGGTGKTPMVAAVASWFVARGVRPVILSRGYRALSDAANDEKLVLDQICPGVAHLQSPDRVSAAHIACRSHAAGVLILDDGFQHRRLARDVDIVLLDALEPWGYGHLLPRGVLREPRSSLRRADLIVLTRADQVSEQCKQAIRRAIRDVAGHDRIAEAVFEPTALRNSSGERQSIEALHGEPLAAFCGIGNPEGFRRTLMSAGACVSDDAFRTFPDHHHYTQSDLACLSEWARGLGVSAVATTQKDLVKIPHNELGGLPLWAVTIEARLLSGGEFFDAVLDRVLPSR